MNHRIAKWSPLVFVALAAAACGGADPGPVEEPVVQAPKEKAPPAAKAIVKVQDGQGGCDTCFPLPPPGHP